jgi:hypothetical protein
VTYRDDTDAKDLDISAKKDGALASGSFDVHLCDDGSFFWADEIADDDPRIDEHDTLGGGECYVLGHEIYDEVESKNADGKVITDDEGDAVMERTDNIIVGRTTYTTDQIVRAYLLDYPLLMSGAAEAWQESVDDSELSDEEKSDLSKYLDEAMRDMGVLPGGSSQAVASDSEDQAAAEELLKMLTNGEITMGAGSCASGGSVYQDVKFIADNGNAHYYNDGNCSSPDTSVSLADGLMQFIVAAAKKLKESDIVLKIAGLVASAKEQVVDGQMVVGIPGTNSASLADSHHEGKSVDLICPEDSMSDCQRLLSEIATEYGFYGRQASDRQATEEASSPNGESTTEYMHFQKAGF